MINKLVRPQIRQMEEIDWGDIPEKEGARLLWGENPLVIKEAIDAIKSEADKTNLYPSPTKNQLKSKLAEYNKVRPENILPTNGSDEALELIAKVFLAEGEEVIMPAPSYPCFESVSAMMGATVKKVLLNENFSLNVERLLRAITTKTKVVWVANPNNPTGNIVASLDQLEDIVSRVNALIVIDECYFELAGETAADLIWEYPNIVIARSFSKIFSLAGARLGYIIADKRVNCYLNRLQQSSQVFNVNRFAQAAGIAVLGDKSIVRKAVNEYKGLKQKFERRLRKINGVEVIPTKTTFCLLNIEKAKLTSTELNKKLLKRGIYIKDCSIYEGLGKEYVYLGVPAKKYQDEVVKGLQEALKKTDNLAAVDAVIFDLDGTLVDTSRSYKEALKKSVEFLLQVDYDIEWTVNESDIKRVKEVPGFNNEWDTAIVLIELIKNNVPRDSWEGFLQKTRRIDRNTRLFKRVFEIFQAYYLGSNLYKQLYKKNSPLSVQSGFIENEALLVSKEVLQQLQENNFKLGVATGRPRFEALYALKKFGLIPRFFNAEEVVALEDTKNEKPAPDALLKAKKLIGSDKPVYVGDSVNDVLAAKNAGIISVFVGDERLGNWQIIDVNQVQKIFCSSK